MEETSGETQGRCKDNFKMDLTETGCEWGLHSSGSGWGPVVDYCKDGDEPSDSIRGGAIYPLDERIRFSWRTLFHEESFGYNCHGRLTFSD
jgi:hypothetical protein